jgi:hypothetical protein
MNTFAQMIDAIADVDFAEVAVKAPKGHHEHDGDMRAPFADAAAALRFIHAGKATITLVSSKTGNRFTYRINQSDDGQAYFVNVLTGADNESSYSYLGRISRDIFWLGRKVARPGDISRDAPCAKAFDWAWRALVKGNMPPQLQVWHEGRCGRCARKLTVPESIAAGFGPECQGKV